MFHLNARIAAVFAYCVVVIALMAVAPWIDWARYGNVWVANLAALPVVPAMFLLLAKKFKFA